MQNTLLVACFQALGMVEAVVPANGKLPEALEGMKVVRVHSLSEAISWLMDKK